jgi:hypothetical protein
MIISGGSVYNYGPLIYQCYGILRAVWPAEEVDPPPYFSILYELQYFARYFEPMKLF